jgi:class 3 adenylate cyclase
MVTASKPPSSAEMEIAHVLFMDLVGYSRLPMDQQTQTIAQLQQMLRATPEFQRSESRNELIRLPTGDGMALVFFRNPIAAVQCAMELGVALRSQPQIQLRMGVHSGPVHRIEDINASVNVAGTAMNLAQRVMDCGDAGHILLSSVGAEILAQVGGPWPKFLHDLGECEVKHAQRIRLYNFYSETFGNPVSPGKLRRIAQATAQVAGTPGSLAGGPCRVVLLYKRNAQPDELLMKRLEAHLQAMGCAIFVDRNLTVGVEWAKEIESQIRSADAVIPLLSAQSIRSEMLAYELQIARDAAAARLGQPRILPVRVRFADPLPAELASILDSIQYFLWEEEAHNERLLSELTAALSAPLGGPSRTSPPKLEAVGGAVPLDSQFYVVRSTDEEFHAAIARHDSIVLVKGARQMGKTSLLARGLQQARREGAQVVLTDFQKLNTADLVSAQTLLMSLAESLADQLDLKVSVRETWNLNRGPSVNFDRFLRREVLGNSKATVVWGLDEVDRLFVCDFASEIFGLFRSWHNERALDPAGPWSRISLAIAYATEAHLFITDVNQSPFNVGTRLALEDFTLEQVADLNQRYGQPLRNSQELTGFFALVGGHPYLVRCGLRALSQEVGGFKTFESHADRDEGAFGDHLRRMLVLLAKDNSLADVVRDVLRGLPCPTAESFYRLRSAGVLAGSAYTSARLRCQLYANYLSRHLLAASPK